MNWDEKLKEILKEKGRGKCPTCGREIDIGDISWNNKSTITPYCVVEIQCLTCDTEIAKIHSWYPEIEDIEDLCRVLKSDLEAI